jgi:hypothetical protein
MSLSSIEPSSSYVNAYPGAPSAETSSQPHNQVLGSVAHLLSGGQNASSSTTTASGVTDQLLATLL